ncbi:MAG: hypothetical protein K0S32_4302 [Bacteroidetes bacterium]|jgi:tetratricopeptide (TPR) repeat protein|nr:hypothetical protein [Bacteroidota bacterium]
MKKNFLLIALLLVSMCVFSQSNKLDKKMEKAYGLVDKGKIKEAGEYMDELLEENPEFGKGWDYLSKIRYKEYDDAKKSDDLFKNLTVTTKSKDGKATSKDDSLSKALLTMLTSISPSKKAYSKYLYTLRQATLYSDDAYFASSLIRSTLVDVKVDTNVNKKALKHFYEAEEEFSKKNYENAAKLYKRAVEEQPGFYKATMYMGDCFYFTGNYPNAIDAFRTAISQHPNLLEPRKYLIDTYLKAKLYDKVIEESVQAMAVYPDLSIAVRMEDAIYYTEKKMNAKWMPRGVFPNKIISDTAKTDLNEYKETKEKKVKEPWTFYQEALTSIKPFCNEAGVMVKATPLTNAKYLEVFSWEEMLKKSTDPSLEEARKMQAAGYLDCYVLVTCFHQDFYKQYKDFASKNKDKIAEYYKKFIVAKN